MEIPEPGEVFHGDDGTTSVVLAESHDPNYEPTQEELEEYAAYIGLDLAKEPQLKWIAMEGLRAALPPEWRACKTGDGEIYYFNFANGESLWEHPLDEKFKQKVIAERAKLNTAAASSSRSSPPSSARATATANATKSESAKASNTTTSTSSSRRTNTTVGATKAISAALLGFASEDTHKAAEPSAAQLLLRPGLNGNSKSTTSSGNALTHLVPPRLETLPTASSLPGRPALPDVLTEGGAHHGSPLLETVMHNNNNNNNKNNNATTAMTTVASSVKSGNSPAPFGALSMGSPSITPTSTTTATTTSVGFGMGSPNGPPSAAAASGPMMMMGSRDIEATIRKRVEDEYAPRRRAVRLQLDKELIAERAQLAQKLSALREELQQARQRDKAQAIAKAAGANNNNSNTTTSDGDGAQQEEEQVWARRLQSAQTQRDALQSKVREREAAVQEVRGRSLLQLERELAARTDKEVDAQRRALQAETDTEVKRIDEEEEAKLQKLQAELAGELNEVQAAEEAATRRADELNASQSEKMLKMLREALRSQQDKLAEAKKTKQQQQQQQQQTEKDEQSKTGDDDALSEKDEAVVRQVERACAEALASLEADYAQQQASLEAKIAEAKKAAHQETTTNTANTASAAAADETVDYAAKLKAEEAALSAELQRRRTAYEQETNALVAKAASEAAQRAASSTPSTQAPQEATKRGQETPRAVQDAEKACAQSSQVHAIRTRHVAAVKQLELMHEKTMRELRQGHTRRLAELGTFDPRKTPEYSAGLTERKRAWLAAHPAPTFTLPTGGGTKAAQPSGPSSAMQAAPSSAGEEMDEVTVEESVVRKAVEEKLAEVRAEMHEAQARALDELATRKTTELASFGERYRAEQLKKARSELEQEQRMHAASKNEALEKEDEGSAQEEEEDDVTEETLTTLRTSVAALKQRVAQASKEETTGKETSAVQDEDEEGVSAEQATREQSALRTRWQGILQGLQTAIAQEMERNAQLRRALAGGAATSTTAMSAQADSAPLPLAASYLAPMGGSNTSGEAANLSLSHDRPPTAPSAASTAAAASWANNMRASTPPVSWSTPAAVNNSNNNNNNTMSVAAGGQTPNTPIHASQRIASHTVGELYARAGPGTHRQHNHPYAITTTINNYMNEDSTTGNAFAALPYFTSEASSLSATALPHGLVSSALRPKPHSPLVSTSGLVGNTSTVAPRKELGSLSTLTQSSPAQPPRTQPPPPPPPQQQQEERRVLVQEDTNSSSNNNNNNKSSRGKREAVREAVAGDVDTAMISGRRSPWYSSSVNSSNASAAGALEGGQRLQHAQAADTNDVTAGDGMSEAAPMSLASYGQRLAVLRDALHARRQALLACQRELQEVREEWRRDMHACRARHDRLQAQELRKTKAALEDYARALNEAVLRVKAASHEWRAQQARYRATLAALTTQTQTQLEKEEEDEEGEGRVRHGAATQRSGGASQALSSATGPVSSGGGSGGSSFMVDQLQQLVRRAAELERMLPNARHAA